MKERIRKSLLDSGACAVGFSEAGEIDSRTQEAYQKWIGEGCNGEMAYLERHLPLRKHTDYVLPGAKTVISIAFDYTPEKWRDDKLPYISAYSYGEDYHIVLKDLLYPKVEEFKREFGGKWRICIDSAPLAERYWALKCGIGKRGLNGSVIVSKAGALAFLVEILTTLEIEPDRKSEEVCNRCGECLKICPTQALRGDGTMDARKCINYLTIEKKGNFSEEEKEILRRDKGYMFGCDKCLRVCPHNSKNLNTQAQKLFGSKITELSPENILSIEEWQFKQLFKKSPLLYAGYERLRRNISALKESSGNQ